MWWNWIMHEKLEGKMSSLSSWMLGFVVFELIFFKKFIFEMLNK
jgi:hypothetical protein